MAIQKLKTMQFKGKPYVEVKERLRHFRENYEGFSLESEIIKMILRWLRTAKHRLMEGLSETLESVLMEPLQLMTN